MSVRRLWRLWALLLVAVVLAWLTLSTPTAGDKPTLVAARQNARLPNLAPAPVPADPGPALAVLSQSTLWGPLQPRPASGAAGGAPPAPQWAVTGYYELSGKRFVIVSFDQQALPSQQLSVADRLPDGSRIAQIEPDRVRVWRAPGRRASRPGGDGCDAAEVVVAADHTRVAGAGTQAMNSSTGCVVRVRRRRWPLRRYFAVEPVRSRR